MEKAKLTLKCVTRIFSWMLFRLFTATRGSERRSCWAPAMVDAMLHTLDSCMELSPLLKKRKEKKVMVFILKGMPYDIGQHFIVAYIVMATCIFFR